MPAWTNLTNVTFDEVQIGASANLTRTLSQTDIEMLALVSGDVDPFHVGDGEAPAAAYLATPYARRITGSTVYVDAGLNIMA
ncbi:MAG: hypothetical protein U0736_01420 [Gemmataceae bacterium]